MDLKNQNTLRTLLASGAALACGLLTGTASAQPFSFDGNILLDGGNFPIAAFPTDFNGDGAMDFIGLERDNGRVTLFQSDGADEPTFTQQQLAFGVGDTFTMFIADVDGDGDPDIVAGSRSNQRVRWLRNNNGASTTAFEIFTGADGIASVYANDLDGDGDIDVASASETDNTIRWHENDGAVPPSWTTHVIDDQAIGAFSIYGGDWEGDGDIDLFTACQVENTIRAHFNNGNPNPNFNSGVLFNNNVNDPRSVFVSDMDGDGDNDLLFGEFNSGEIRYIRNNGAGNPLNIRTVTSSAGGIISIFAADMDGDGDNDVLSAERVDDRFRWFENDGTADPSWSARTIVNSVDGPRSIFPVDLDADGDTDVLTTSTGDNSFRWYENDNGIPLEVRNASAGTDHNTIAGAINGASVSDLLRSKLGRFASEPSIDFAGKSVHLRSVAAITQPVGGVYTLADNASLASSALAARSVQVGPNVIPLAAALGTDTIDLFGQTLAPAGAFALLETGAMTAHTGSQITLDLGASLFVEAEGGARFNAPVDLGPNASLAASHDLVLAAAGDYAKQDVFDAGSNSEFAIAADIDGDGDADVITSELGGGGSIRWHENDGAANPSFADRLISNSGVAGARAIVARDIDSDGDLDVVSVSQESDSVYWHENDGAADPAFTSNLVADAIEGVRGVDAADLDGDGDLDIVSAALDETIRWYENDGAADPAFSMITIASDALNARSVFAADIDGDGDTDILASSHGDTSIRWYENDGAADPSFTDNVIDASVSNPWTVIASDVDSDGDQDVLTVSGGGDLIIWFENDGAVDPSFTRHDIFDDADGARTVHAADMDGDGDVDILSLGLNDDTLRLHENDGASDPAFTVRELDATIPGGFGVFAADLDGDGDMDALSTSQGDGVIHWHENLSDGMGLAAGATLAADGSVFNGVSLAFAGGAIVADDGFENNAVLFGFGDVFADTANDGAVRVTADTQIVGDYTNNGTTTIQSGTLTVLGELTDNGVIVGDFTSARGGEAGGMFAESGYTAGANASLGFPGGGLASMGGDYDVAIDSNARYDMADAELRMVGVAGTQSLEVMSADIGPDRDGLDRTLSGHFPLGTLRVGPTATTVELVDAHDNDGLGQADCEALYVAELIIDAGATLNTNGCVIYYDALISNGAVDEPANLIPLPGSCAADLTGNGVVNSGDLAELLSAWGQSGPADFTGDGVVDAADLAVLLAAWGAC